MSATDHTAIRQLFDDYLRMYANRDDRLTSCFSENFSGFTGGGDVLVKERDQWIVITRQDFAQVKDPLRIELKDLAIQSITDTVAVATGFFTIHLPLEDHILSQETARLVLIFHQESEGWKISHSSISIPYHLVRDGEVYPLQELAARNQFLENMVTERTGQLSRTNDQLQQINEDLAREVAEHKKTEEALRESEAHYRLLTENASDVVWRLDSEYRFTYISPADERQRGYRADEVIGHHVFELFGEDGIATVKRMAYLRNEAERNGTQTGTVTFEAQHRCKDGRWVWAEVSYTPERDTDGVTVGFHGISREITDRKLAEEESRRAKIAAEEANKAKSEFLALVSHEIRTPLNALVGFSSLACTATDPAKLDTYHAILEKSSQSLMALVNDILDMSKIEAGRIELEYVPLNLHHLLDSLKEQYAALADQKDVTFTISVADMVPAWVLGDPLRLRQILANLLSNAIKFTECGSVSCSISIQSQTEGEGSPVVYFEVRDTGIGIPDDKRALLFQPFRQLDPAITRRYGGTGLGLAIVHSLTVMMNGRITLESREGAGSCFIVELPLQETEAVTVNPAPPVTLSSGTILVVEDNEYNRHLLGDILASWGQQIILAEDGWQALRLLEQQPFDLVLLDIHMPRIDGIEVACRIRCREKEHSETPVPIIAITADTDTATREACVAAGINRVLAKPVIPEQLAKTITDLYGKSAEGSCGEYLPLNGETRKGLRNDPERSRQFGKLLRKDINDELKRLNEALERDGRDDLVRSAHTLKGLLLNLANSGPARQAAWLQENAASATPEQVRQVIEQLMKNKHTVEG